MKRKTGISVILIVIMAFTVLAGCGEAETQANLSEAIKTKYKVATKIAYSADNQEEWTYKNLKKEFSAGQPCYVRLDMTPTTNHLMGVGEEITATIKFIGVKKCSVESTDGIVSPKKTKSDNKKAYTITLTPQKEKKAETVTYIFKYKPKKACKMVVKVLFDDKVDKKDDKKSAIYFQ